MQNRRYDQVERLRSRVAPVASAGHRDVNDVVLHVDDFNVAAVATQNRPNRGFDRLLDALRLLIRREFRELARRRFRSVGRLERRVLHDVAGRGRRNGRQRNEAGLFRLFRDFRRFDRLRRLRRSGRERSVERFRRRRGASPARATAAAPNVVQNILNFAAARPAGAPGFQRAGYFVGRFEPKFANLAAQVRFGNPETLANDASFVDVVPELLETERFQIDAATRRPVPNRFFERFGAHHGAVHLLRRKPFQKFDDVLIGDLQRVDRGRAALFDDATKRFRRRDRRRAAERQELRLDDFILRRVGFVALDAKSELQRVPASDRAVFADAVRVLDFADVRPGFSLNGVHK